eukprot:1152197-Pelagomonas_calceolata.AAC.1
MPAPWSPSQYPRKFTFWLMGINMLVSALLMVPKRAAPYFPLLFSIYLNDINAISEAVEGAFTGTPDLPCCTVSRLISENINLHYAAEEAPQALLLTASMLTCVSSRRMSSQHNTVMTPGPRISLRPLSSSTVTPGVTVPVAIFQGPQLKSPSIPFC